MGYAPKQPNGRAQNRVRWPESTRLVLALVLAAAGIWFLIRINPILETALIGGMIAYFLHPAAKALAKRARLSYESAARFVFVLFLVLLAAIPALVGTVAFMQASRFLGSELSAVAAEITAWLSRPQVFMGYVYNPENLVDPLSQAFGQALGTISQRSGGLLTDVTLNFVWVALIVICAYYFLKDGPSFRQRVLAWLPETYQPDAQRLLVEVDAIWRVALRVQILIFVILAILMSLGTLGVIWLFHSGLLAFSPLALVLMLVLVYTAAQQVDNLWLRPRWMGRRLKLHPGLVLVSLLGALALGGLLAALLIVPILATVKLLAVYGYRKYMGLPAWDEIRADSPAEEIGSENRLAQEKS